MTDYNERTGEWDDDEERDPVNGQLVSARVGMPVLTIDECIAAVTPPMLISDRVADSILYHLRAAQTAEAQRSALVDELCLSSHATFADCMADIVKTREDLDVFKVHAAEDRHRRKRDEPLWRELAVLCGMSGVQNTRMILEAAIELAKDGAAALAALERESELRAAAASMTPDDLVYYRELKRWAREEFESLNRGVAWWLPVVRPYVGAGLEAAEETVRLFEATHPDIRPLTAPVDYVVTVPSSRAHLSGRVERAHPHKSFMRNLRGMAEGLERCKFDSYPSDLPELREGATELNRRIRAAAALLLAPWNGWEPGSVR